MLICLSAPLFPFNVPYTSLPYSPPTILLLASAKSDYSPFPVHTSNYPALGFCSCCSPLLVKNKYILSTFYIPSPVLDMPQRTGEKWLLLSWSTHSSRGERQSPERQINKEHSMQREQHVQRLCRRKELDLFGTERRLLRQQSSEQGEYDI